MMNYGWYGGGYGSALPLLGVVMMFVWWAFIIIVIVALIRWLRMGMPGLPGEGRHHRHGSVALDILKERYAKGEISKEKFEEMKKDVA